MSAVFATILKATSIYMTHLSFIIKSSISKGFKCLLTYSMTVCWNLHTHVWIYVFSCALKLYLMHQRFSTHGKVGKYISFDINILFCRLRTLRTWAIFKQTHTTTYYPDMGSHPQRVDIRTRHHTVSHTLHHLNTWTSPGRHSLVLFTKITNFIRDR